MADMTHAASPASLLLRCAEGDRAAFRALYDQQSPRLFGVALRITRQSSLAADAVHDTFVQVWQRAGRFDMDRGSVEAWLLGLVRYRAIDIVRRRSREQPGATPLDRADPAPGPLEALSATEDSAALRRCLLTLPEERRSLVVMAFMGGLTHVQLSARLGVPLGTVKAWIRRSLASLRLCLGS